MDIKPLNNNVLLALEAEKTEKRSASGLILPSSSKPKNKQAQVVALGEIENAEISVGDTVLYKEFTGTEIEVEGQKYLLIPYADIYGKMVETEAI